MARTPAIVSVDGTATRATNLYDLLRADIVGGDLEPGSKLAIEALAERYGASATPLREALNRLVSDGLVERREQRGFYVAGIGAADLQEITKTRCWLEAIALRESIAARTTEWEEALVLAHHRLARTPRSLSDSRFEDNPEWEPRHRAFHRALIARLRLALAAVVLRPARRPALPLPAAVGAARLRQARRQERAPAVAGSRDRRPCRRRGRPAARAFRAHRESHPRRPRAVRATRGLIRAIGRGHWNRMNMNLPTLAGDTPSDRNVSRVAR